MAVTNFQRTIAKYLLVFGAASILTACGGGGSGGENKDTSITFTPTGPTRINFYAQRKSSELPQNVMLTGKVSKAITKLYINVDLTAAPQLISEVYFIPDTENAGALSFKPALPATLPRGKHSQTVSVKLCEDALCQRQLKGSPVKIDVEYIIDTDNPFSLAVTNSDGGTVTQSTDFFQCSESACQNTIYGLEGETFEFTAHAKPGYKFSHWSGDCVGGGSCFIPFSVNGSANIRANFSSVAAEENICSATSSYSGVAEGALNLGRATSFLPLCKGLVLASYEDRIDLIDVFNSDTPVKSFAFDLKPFKMKVDAENGLLYVSHSGANYISRVDIHSETISKIYIPRTSATSNSSNEEALVVASNGYVLVSSPIDRNELALWVVDGISALRVKRLPRLDMVLQGFPKFYYSTQSNMLSVQQHDLLTTYLFDPVQLTIKLNDLWRVRYESYSAPTPIAISPDGLHIAEKVDALVGQLSGSALQHFSPSSRSVDWVWHTSPGSRSLYAAFSPDNNYVGVMNDIDFSLDVYTLLGREHISHFSEVPEDCISDDRDQSVAFSDDESIFFGMRVCSYTNYDSILNWSKFR